MPTPHDSMLYEQRILKMLPSFPHYVQEYINYLDQTEASILTQLNYLHEYEHFLTWLWKHLPTSYPSMKDIPYTELEHLKLDTVHEYFQFYKNELIEVKKGVKKKRSTAARNRNMSALKALFHFLTTRTEKEDGECYFYRNVMEKVKIQMKKETANKRAKKIGKDLLKTEEINLLLDFIRYEYEKILVSFSKRKLNQFLKNKERDIAIMSLLLGTGLRVSELASIEVSSIDFIQNQIDVVRKGDIEDAIEVLPLAMDDVRAYLSVRKVRYGCPDDYPYLFVSNYGKKIKPISVRSIQNLVQIYTKAFKGKPLSPHKLRHTYATDYLRNGGNLVMLRDQLGHSSIETTTKYTNFSLDERKKVIHRMNDERLGIKNEKFN